MHTATKPLTTRRIFRTWWPLAASWLLMGAELPAISAVMARLATPEISLAAYGGVVFPLALIIEAPIIMLLAASTALSKDWASYVKIRRFMNRSGALLTMLHILVAFTPLYYVVVADIIGAPTEIIEPARIGLMIMTPWTWSIAIRRFNQGVLIRFEHSQSVGIGTAIRLGANFIVLAIGYSIGTIPGIIIGPTAIISGVLSETLYIWLRVRPVLRNELKPLAEIKPALDFKTFIVFYIPLAMTSFLQLLFQPIGSAAMSRMPLPIESLAVWPVVAGFSFMFRSLGVAFNEVVVALLDEPAAIKPLRRFAVWMAIITTVVQLLVGFTPLAGLWFAGISGLRSELAHMATVALIVGAAAPGLSVVISWYQGALVHSRQTRGIPESMAISLVAIAAILVAGVIWNQIIGLYVGFAAMTLGFLAQAIWLWFRMRPVIRTLQTQENNLLLTKETTG